LSERADAVTVIDVLKPGLLASIQDQGRPGQAHLALSRGGAMDRSAMALANVLVGNAPGEAGVEITGPGPTLRFRCDAWIASVGALHRIVRVADESGGVGVPLPSQRPMFVTAGSVLRWQAPPVGWRSWLAVAGGLDLPTILASRSAHLAAGIGPERLVAGQQLRLVEGAAELARRRAAAVLGADRHRSWPRWQIADDLPRAWPSIDLPVLVGRHLALLSAAARDALFAQHWTVSPESNRQGMRVQGAALDTRALPQLASEPVSFGTMQLPNAGLPVILLAEHQTTGGYPRILEVASAAEHVLAQAGAGCRMRFRLIGLDEADALARRQAHDFAQRLASVRRVCAYPSE
jgi:antagonist of KipI